MTDSFDDRFNPNLPNSLFPNKPTFLSDILPIRKPYTVIGEEGGESNPYRQTIASFSRSREITIPWNDVTDDDKIDVKGEMGAIRDAFESSWNGHPLEQSNRFSFFITKASDDIGNHIEGVKPGDVLLIRPGPKRKILIQPNIIKSSSTSSFRNALRTIRQIREMRMPYLGWFPALTTHYYKLEPTSEDFEFDFWSSEDSYNAAWDDVEAIVQVTPLVRFEISTETRQTLVNAFGTNFSISRSNSTVKNVETWEDTESNEVILPIDPTVTVSDLRAIFEKEWTAQAFSGSQIANDIPLPFLLYDHTQSTKYYIATNNNSIYGNTQTEQLPDNTIIIFSGNNQKAYRLILHRHAQANPAATYDKLLGKKDISGYESVWNQDIKGFERVYQEGELEKVASEGFFLDMIPQYIKLEFVRLDSRRQYLSKLAENAQQLVPDDVSPSSVTIGELSEILARYEEIHRLKNDNDIALSRLQSIARERGLVLAINDNEINIEKPKEDGTTEPPIPLKKGELYQLYMNYISWTETVHRPMPSDAIPLVYRPRQPQVPNTSNMVLMGGLLGGLGDIVRGVGGAIGGILGGPLGPVGPVLEGLFRRRGNASQRTYHRTKVVRYKDYELLRFHESPQDQVRAQLSNQGFTVFIFRLSDDGYVDENGRSLSELMNYCRTDEEFRRRIAVLIPQYSESLEGGLTIQGYHVIKKPTPGNDVIEPPRLWIEDKLSYEMKWLGTELGTLIGSINLAPGENRNITITRKVETRTETIENISQEYQLDQNFTNSFTSEFENTVRQEKEKTGKSNWSAKASGSFMGITGGANAGGSSSQTVEDFAETIHKVARKAASNITKKQSLKITTSTTQSASIFKEDSTTSEFKNINQGRTLNLFFHGLNNVFENSVRIEDIKIGASSGVELISGTGIVDKITVPPQSVERALLEFIGANEFYDNIGLVKARIANIAFDALRETIYREYAFDKPTVPLNGENISKSLYVPPLDEDAPLYATDKEWLMKSERSLLDKPSYINSNDNLKTILDNQNTDSLNLASINDDELKDIIDNFSETKTDELAWTEMLYRDLIAFGQCVAGWSKNRRIVYNDIIQLPSMAVYFDSVLGEKPATEPYSDHMRQKEYEIKSAEIDEIRGRTKALYGYESSNTIWITGVISNESRNEYILVLSDELKDPSSWNLYYGNIELNDISISEQRVNFQWIAVEGIPDNPSEIELRSHLHLRNSVDSSRIYFVNKN
ncbi:hypothetical protein [Candidatus Thiodiazotropha endoloripes]|nr:hypothetical protein [Candidatus Thiodiazotropha endoloripes]MCG7983769.1 hypothetical protein [Candidatus Thiodiazotropha lotti]